MYTSDKLLVNVIEEKIPFTVVFIYNIYKVSTTKDIYNMEKSTEHYC